MFELIAEGLHFPESPVWSARERCLYLVEWQGDRILAVEDGVVSTLFDTAIGSGPSGLGQDEQGNFWVCLYDLRQVVQYTPAGAMLQAVSEYQGMPFKGPCDLVMDPAGGLYFTDSGDFADDWKTGRPAGAVYHLAPSQALDDLARMTDNWPLHTGGLSQVDRGLCFPNGIALSPGGEYLLVNEHRRNRTLRYPRQAGGSFSPAQVFYQHDSACLLEAEFAFELGPDGMCVEDTGNVWVAHYGGGKLLRLSPQGTLLQQLPLPRGRKPTNAAYDPAQHALYITEAEQGLLYRVTIGG